MSVTFPYGDAALWNLTYSVSRITKYSYKDEYFKSKGWVGRPSIVLRVQGQAELMSEGGMSGNPLEVIYMFKT